MKRNGILKYSLAFVAGRRGLAISKFMREGMLDLEPCNLPTRSIN